MISLLGNIDLRYVENIKKKSSCMAWKKVLGTYRFRFITFCIPFIIRDVEHLEKHTEK